MTNPDILAARQDIKALLESLGQLRHAQAEILRRLEAVEERLATLTAAHESAIIEGELVGTIEGLPGNVTISSPPGWDGPESEGMA